MLVLINASTHMSVIKPYHQLGSSVSTDNRKSTRLVKQVGVLPGINPLLTATESISIHYYEYHNKPCAIMCDDQIHHNHSNVSIYPSNQGLIMNRDCIKLVVLNSSQSGANKCLPVQDLVL